jgi:hypothetical protein
MDMLVLFVNGFVERKPNKQKVLRGLRGGKYMSGFRTKGVALHNVFECWNGE